VDSREESAPFGVDTGQGAEEGQQAAGVDARFRQTFQRALIRFVPRRGRT
jgi:hypothetical protein